MTCSLTFNFFSFEKDLHRETTEYRRLTQINLTSPALALRRGESKSTARSSIISDAEQAKLRMLSSVTTSSPRQRALLRILVTEHCFVHLLRTLFVVFVEPLTNAATGAADLPEGARGRGAAQLQSTTASIMGSTGRRGLDYGILLIAVAYSSCESFISHHLTCSPYHLPSACGHVVISHVPPPKTPLILPPHR